MDTKSAAALLHCYPGPVLSSPNQLTRLNTVSTMSRLETSPTSTRPASTANFILMPLMGTAGLSAMELGLPSASSPGGAAPGGSSLAIAKEGRTGQVALTGKAPVHLHDGDGAAGVGGEREIAGVGGGSISYSRLTMQMFPSPSKAGLTKVAASPREVEQ